jgi:hypothetical protein
MVIGKPEKVLILDGTKILAEHVRSYDKGQEIEDAAHIAALAPGRSAPRTELFDKIVI